MRKLISFISLSVAAFATPLHDHHSTLAQKLVMNAEVGQWVDPFPLSTAVGKGQDLLLKKPATQISTWGNSPIAIATLANDGVS